MHTCCYQIIPYSLKCLVIIMESGQCVHLCHSRIKISRTHGMSHRFRLLADRCMLLCISSCHHPFTLRTVSNSANLQKFFSHIKIQWIIRHPIQFTKSQFYFLMSGSLINRFSIIIIWISSFKENLIHMFGTLNSNI